MASPAPAPVPSTGTGRGGTGRLSSLPTPLKVGGVVVIVGVGWFLWKKRQANAAANAAVPGATVGATSQDYGFAPGGLSPTLLGYNPTGQITGYDVNGNPIYGVTPPSSPTPPSPTNPGQPSSGGGGNPATGGPPLPVPSLPPAPVQGLPGIPVFTSPQNYISGSPFFTPGAGTSPSGQAPPTKGSSGQTIGTYTWVSPGGPGMDPAGTLEFTGYPPPPGV